ncbi:plasmalemma vesicle associated protein b [Mugil cephalus]|uniref:plasmalemma vesicle associated protein b n=1 Tax=Mugil cephalus TaxID=48193 RepID=UPI001FB73003|nr:plasmalemma vesicle associated protein b [Mugil cephalus]
MYNSSYSRAKLGLASRDPMHRSKGKSCGYYMRIIFFFSSLIQSLIIVSLVLFLIYGQPEKSAEEKRVKDLELSFNKLSANNIQLRKEKGDLTAQLGARTAEKTALEKEMEKLKNETNATEQALKVKLTTCERMSVLRRTVPNIPSPVGSSTCCNDLKSLTFVNSQQDAMIKLLHSNFTQKVQYMSQERDSAIKDRDKFNQEAIALRRENTMVREQLAANTRKCKEDFTHSLDGIQEVTKSFLNRINTLFQQQPTFHLTCQRQQEQMDKIRNSCTNLSTEVENKFQLYLDNVGNKVAEIQSLSSRLEVEKAHLTSDLQECTRKSREAAAEAARELQEKQKTHDDQVEKLILEQNRLRDEKKLQEDSLTLKDDIIEGLKRTIDGAKVPPGPPKVPAVQGTVQQDRQTPPKWSIPVGGAGVARTPTVR